MLFWTKTNLSLIDIDRTNYKGMYRPIAYFKEGLSTSALLYMDEGEELPPGKEYKDRFIGFYNYDLVSELIKENTSIILKEGSIEIGTATILEIMGFGDTPK